MKFYITNSLRYKTVQQNYYVHSIEFIFQAEAVGLAGLALCAIHSKNLDEAKELLEVITKHYKDDLENPYVKKVCYIYTI
jgi:hypothetical protein